ncbi:hypothetical protein SAMN06295967_1116 [Belliella buryatensis]|uniref:Uncharacterized protein n=1 Tax=Belliella buryatensis TaxID=1500549 RepID=A0A239EXP0_9BACT|nr:hypothetical protein SAMN06295967_1116 [Belliella buryatensis]
MQMYTLFKLNPNKVNKIIINIFYEIQAIIEKIKASYSAHNCDNFSWSKAKHKDN